MSETPNSSQQETSHPPAKAAPKHNFPSPKENEAQKTPIKDRMWDFYSKKYKLLLLFPLALLLLSLGIIGFYYANFGDVIVKDVSLKGGATITVPLQKDADIAALEHSLKAALPSHDIMVRGFGIAGSQQGVIVSADIDINNKEQLTQMISTLSKSLGISLKDGDYGMEFFGSSLGSGFFRESIIILLLAFALMSLVVFAYFRTFIPSLAIILAAVGDMIAAIAFIDLFGIPIGTAGIAAFLMLIGYSVDTDILLTIRVLKRKEGSVDERVKSSIKTGVTQTAIAILAMAIGFFMAQSDIIRQIMLILIVGLSADLIFTWIMNVGLLRYYLEQKEKKSSQSSYSH